MEDFDDLKARLHLTPDNCLELDGVPMILTPRWFFAGIMKHALKEAGLQTASTIYYNAGFDGAYSWGKKQIEKGLTGRSIMEQYLGSMTSRGWGVFQIAEYDEELGKGRFIFRNSAMALESGKADHPVCLWVPGALAGAFQVILDQRRIDLRVKAAEKQCASQGHPHCEFYVSP